MQNTLTRPALSLLSLAILATLPARAAPVVWSDTAGSSYWDIASNWVPGLPGPGDDATIDVTGTRTITVRSTGSPFELNSITMTGDETLAIASGTLTLDGLGTADNVSGQSLLAHLHQTGGILGGSGAVIVTGDATVAGTQSGSGTTTLQGTSTFGSFYLDGGRTVTNEGTATLTAGMNLNIGSDAGAGRIENAQAGVLDVRTSNRAISASSFAGDDGSDAAVDNAGIFRRSTAGGYTINVRFINQATGLIDVQAGGLTFNNDSDLSGAVSLASGSYLSLAGGGTHTLRAGASFTGDGTLSLGGPATVLEVASPVTVDSAFSMSGGTLEGADLVLAGPSTLSINTSYGVMTGPGTTTLRGDGHIYGGGNNPFGLDAGRVLRVEGNTVIGGSISVNYDTVPGSGRIENAAGAVIDVQSSNHSIYARSYTGDDGSDARVDNAGTFRKSTTGNYGVGVTFNNLATGTVDVQAGTFTFSGGGDDSGVVNLASGASLSLAGGTHTIRAGASFTGDGTLVVAGGGTVVHVMAPTAIDTNFTMSGGTVEGADLVLKRTTTLG
ncbi:MAG: hypothetical protein GC151_08610, partial [Betaproteobacteria bacterium]|nr:hypothetical protein [Betaproteobacteria bacterium]